MKYSSILILAFSLLLWSCGEKPAEQSMPQVDVVVTHKDMTGEIAKTVANLSIDGMTCSAGCGGKIQQDLRALNGVKITELDFAEGREQNVVSVEFDPALLSEKDLIKCVGNIADGQYHVKAVEVVSYKAGQSSSTSGAGADVKVENFGRVFQLLNFLQSLTKLIQFAA
jgi:copper chaperone CopZ